MASGDAASWDRLDRVWIGRSTAEGSLYDVESSNSYKDKLVLKLAGIDSPSAAAELRGSTVMLPEGETLPLEEGEYFGAQLVGMEVVDESGRALGRVEDLLPTGGTDLLLVRRQVGGEQNQSATAELMIPLAREIVLEIDENSGRIKVRLPAGLLQLNGPAEDSES